MTPSPPDSITRPREASPPAATSDGSAAATDATGAMRIDVNGEVHRASRTTTVEQLLTDLGLAGKRVAVAVNRDVVVRSRYAAVELAEGDRVEILEAVGGG